jgi:integrase/recombinase XerD
MNYLEKWEEFLIEEEDKSKNTASAYITDVKQFLGFINKDIKDVTKADINKYKESIEELSVKTRNRKGTSINRYIDFLNSRYDFSILATVKQEKLQSQEYLDSVLTREEMERMVEIALEQNDYRAVAIFSTLFYTGMRVSEMLSLKVTDVVDEGRSYKINIKGKGSKNRHVFIPQKLIVILMNYLEHRNNSDPIYLFTGIKGAIERKTVDREIKKYATLANVNMNNAHAHAFRHLYCMAMMEKGVRLDTLADLAGHSNINTTRIYTRQTTQQLLDTVDNL